MKYTIGLIFSSICLFASCSETAKEKKETVQYQQSKETIKQIEKKHPLRFIQVESEDKKNIIGQRVVKGSIVSKATVAVYKDIVIRISFKAATGALLESDQETINELLKPGTSIDFKSKFFPPKGTEQVFVSVISAGVE